MKTKMREIEVRGTGVKVAFNEQFSKKRLSKFIRELVVNDRSAESFHVDPIRELEKQGVEIRVDHPEKYARIDDETLIKLLKVRDEEEGDKQECFAFVILLFSIYESCQSG
jgi:predicted metal-dependent enzyme (double-stranded beta helix superfamily)